MKYWYVGASIWFMAMLVLGFIMLLMGETNFTKLLVIGGIMLPTCVFGINYLEKRKE